MLVPLVMVLSWGSCLVCRDYRHACLFSNSRSLFHSFTLSLFHSFTLSLFHSFTLSLFHSFTLSLFHYSTIPLFHSLTLSSFHLFTFSPFYPYSLTSCRAAVAAGTTPFLSPNTIENLTTTSTNYQTSAKCRTKQGLQPPKRAIHP
jgi:hypothetical protein